jgi:hypothetical protein
MYHAIPVYASGGHITTLAGQELGIDTIAMYKIK